MNISLLHKHAAIEYEIKMFEWKNNRWMKLLKVLNIKTKSLNENRNTEYK